MTPMVMRPRLVLSGSTPSLGCIRINTDQLNVSEKIRDLSARFEHGSMPVWWVGATSGATGQHVSYMYVQASENPTQWQQWIIMRNWSGIFLDDENLNWYRESDGPASQVDSLTDTGNPVTQMEVACDTGNPLPPSDPDEDTGWPGTIPVGTGDVGIYDPDIICRPPACTPFLDLIGIGHPPPLLRTPADLVPPVYGYTVYHLPNNWATLGFDAMGKQFSCFGIGNTSVARTAMYYNGGDVESLYAAFAWESGYGYFRPGEVLVETDSQTQATLRNALSLIKQTYSLDPSDWGIGA